MKCSKLMQNDAYFIMAILFTTDQQIFLNLNGTSQTTWRYRQGLNRKLQILFGKPAEFLPQVAIDRPGNKNGVTKESTAKLHLPSSIEKERFNPTEAFFPKSLKTCTLSLFWV